MNRKLETFTEGEGHVKISHFTKQGADITGVIHIGTNDWYEYEYYKKMGIEHLLGFEPLAPAIERLHKKHPEAEVMEIALGERDRFGWLNVASGDGQSSTVLELTPEYKKEFPDIEFTYRRPINVDSFANWYRRHFEYKINKYNCLVIDVEGMELDVLKGFDTHLHSFKYLSVELSGTPTYIKGPTAQEVIDYLKIYGFKQDSPVEAHNDVFFIRA